MSYIFIADGFFKLFIDGKPVRLYSESDFLVAGGQCGENAALRGDFGGEVAVFPKETFIRIGTRHPKFLDAVFTLADLENSINRNLAAAFMRQDAKADFDLKEYNEGDTIIAEGEQSTDIFEMLSGTARALQGGRQVGRINEGEIFGEVSFFTGEPRNATVEATETCMVRVINQSNFAEMIKTNPNFAISISRTLSRRFSNVNKMLAGKNQ